MVAIACAWFLRVVAKGWIYFESLYKNTCGYKVKRAYVLFTIYHN